MEIWSQDEARVGQKGRTGYVWWQRGHTPRGRRDIGYQSAWIIGAVCPARDTGVALVLTRLDTAAMNLFLAELSQAVAPGAHGVVLMDKAGWHTAGDLVVPGKPQPRLPAALLARNSTRSSGCGCTCETIASRTASSALLTRSSTVAARRGIGCSAKPAASARCVPTPGSHRSAINHRSLI